MFLGLKYMPAAAALHKCQKFTTATYPFTTIVRMKRNQPKTQNHNFIELIV